MLAKLLLRLEGVKETGPDKFKARCPAHDDSYPSLSIKHTGDKTILYCHAGCDTHDILAAIGLDWRDLFDEPLQKGATTQGVGFTPRDALLGLEHDALLISLAAGDMANGLPLDAESINDVRRASLRITAACDFIRKIKNEQIDRKG